MQLFTILALSQTLLQALHVLSELAFWKEDSHLAQSRAKGEAVLRLQDLRIIIIHVGGRRYSVFSEHASCRSVMHMNACMTFCDFACLPCLRVQRGNATLD